MKTPKTTHNDALGKKKKKKKHNDVLGGRKKNLKKIKNKKSSHPARNPHRSHQSLPNSHPIHAGNPPSHSDVSG